MTLQSQCSVCARGIKAEISQKESIKIDYKTVKDRSLEKMGIEKKSQEKHHQKGRTNLNRLRHKELSEAKVRVSAGLHGHCSVMAIGDILIPSYNATASTICQ